MYELEIVRDNSKLSLLTVTRPLLDYTTKKGSHVEILQTDTFGKVLMLDGSIQIAEHEAHKYHVAALYAALADRRSKPDVSICYIGGGTSYGVKYILDVLDESNIKRIDLVDIDAEIITVCACYYDYTADLIKSDKVIIHDMDGYEFLRKSSNKYDLIFLNVPELFDGTQGFYEIESMRNIAEYNLKDDGIYIVGATLDHLKYFRILPQRAFDVIKTMKQVFTYVNAYTVGMMSYAGTRAFIYGSNSETDAMRTRGVEYLAALYPDEFSKARIIDNDYVDLSLYRDKIYNSEETKTEVEELNG